MTYESAPATRMLATHCAVCGNALVDARSVETGIGQVCRERHGYGSAQTDPDLDAAKRALDRAEQIGASRIEIGESPEPREIANRAVHRIASQPEARFVPDLIEAISALGFRKLATVIALRRFKAIKVDRHGDTLEVKTPFNRCFNEKVKRLRGQWWDGPRKARQIPIRYRAELWRIFRECFAAGTMVIGTKVARI